MDRKKTIQVFEDMKRGLYPMYPDEYLDAAIESLSAEPCEDTISRQAVIDILRYECSDKVERYLRDKVEALPPVTPKVEECEDAVSRDYLEECIELMTDINGDTVYAVRMSDIRRLPPVTPKQKMGRWIESDALLMASNEDGCMKFPAKECSVCHKPHIKAYWMDYCPNCGAKMESED